MKAKNFENGVSVVIMSNDINLNEVVVKVEDDSKEVRVFRKVKNGTLREMKRVSSVKKSQIKKETTNKDNTETMTTNYNSNNVVIADTSNREIEWRKFRANVMQEGGIETYIKSLRKNSVIETLLLKYPDFKRGMKLYEAGSQGAWQLVLERNAERVRCIYKKIFMDLDSLLAA